MYKDILVTVDLGDESSWRRALPTAVEYAKAFESRLHVMTVLPDFGMSIVGQFFPRDHEDKMVKGVTEALHAFVKQHVPEGIPVQHIISQGTVYEAILDMAERIKADLIIMAAHRPELRDYLLGPNAARVVRHAHCSVLVVRE
ncbi:universal stress protein [Telmatospirillum sp. J64-1]|uniref:universal stress protein n=1 Tax=Telmatospirillum sp. J64-1 TaxID=2502183 RepID=UPI00115E2556|nr:universal stress protein [Telmatospirillum sp. J64-1]